MAYRLIDMAHDPRGGQYDYFTSLQNPFAGLTVQVDVTDFLSGLDGGPFFLSFLYVLTRAANGVPELRRRIGPDGVREYDWCAPSYTVMRDSGAYAYCFIDGDLPYESFLAEGRCREALSRAATALVEEGDVLSEFFVSCLPWLSYTQIVPPNAGAKDSNPRFAWGRYARQGERMVMPVSVFVNHALADGLHLSRFYDNLECEMRKLTEEIQNSTIKKE